MRTFGAAALASALALAAASAPGQTIYKCKGADGRITYSSQACAGEGAALAKQGPPSSRSSAAASEAAPPAKPVEQVPSTRGTLPRECDNAGMLKIVVARLDSASTPDDVRPFLADERFRLVRCEYVRFTPDERRERDKAMTAIDSRDVATRRAAMLRIQSLYDRYLTAGDRAARAANRQR
jgi:hypothetical protein